MKHLELFDAVRIVALPDGRSEIPAYYSQTGNRQIRVGDIGVVIGAWPNDKYRVEAVNSADQILWQDHFEPAQLEVIPVTAATFCRRRINEHWAYNLALGQDLLDPTAREDALTFARKVMAFARKNVDLLIERLEHSGYKFASRPWRPPEHDIAASVQALSNRGIHVPVALQAWLMEVGTVDLRGTHPEWPRTAYIGIGTDKSSNNQPWCTDPLVVALSLNEDREAEETGTHWIEIAPDIVHKANVSGGAPVSINADRPAFDSVLVNQHGSFTLLSYLRYAFDWGGFPGFDYIADAPTQMLKNLAKGLIRL